MIRILHILHSMNRGGAEAMLMNYYRNIDREKVQFDFLLTEQNHCQYEDEIVSMGGRVFRVPLLTFTNPMPYIRGVRQFLKEHPEYKIVHSHTSSKSAVPLWVAKQCGVPVRVCHSHNNKSETGISGLIRNLLKYPLRKVATDFFSCGDEASRWLYGKKLANSGIVHVLKNAINVEQFAYNIDFRKEIRQKYNIREESIVLGMVARFSHQKNHLFALDVLKSLTDEQQDVKLMLVGDGELRSDIQQKTTQLGITANLIMVGIVPDVYKYLQAMDVVLMPSFNEGLPVSMIEAQARGVKCVISTGVPQEVDVTGNVTSLPLDVNAWTDSIHSMPKGWRDPDAKLKVARAGYDIRVAAKELENWYIDQINSH